MTDPNQTVVVAGASGGTGRQLLRLLDGRDPTVRALTRSPSKTDHLRQLGADDAAVCDLLAGENLAAAVAEADVVLSAVGSSPRRALSATELVDGTGNVALLEAAVDAGVEAFVMVSALGVGDDSPSAMGRLFNLVLRPVQAAKARAEAAVREAPVRHTILRPGVLTNGRRTDDVAAVPPDHGPGLWGAVSRADVARLAAAAPYTGGAADRTFEVVSMPPFRDLRLDVDWRLPRPSGSGASVE